MVKKTEEATSKKEEKPKKKYFVRDTNDRMFTQEVNGFDLTIKAGEEKEVSKEVAEKLSADFAHLNLVSEVNV